MREDGRVSDDTIKLDTQRRTTFAGFGYSNSDPANRHDRSPTDFSYVDFSLELQRATLESRLASASEDERAALEAERETLNETLELRRLRTATHRDLLVVTTAPKLDTGPFLGAPLAYLVLMALFIKADLMIHSAGMAFFLGSFVLIHAWLFSVCGPEEPIILAPPEVDPWA